MRKPQLPLPPRFPAVLWMLPLLALLALPLATLPLLSLSSSPAVAQTPPATATSSNVAKAADNKARVVDVTGKVERRESARVPWKTISEGDLLGRESEIRTGAGAAVLLLLPGGHRMRVGERTTLRIKNAGERREYGFEVLGGQVWSLVRKVNRPARYEVETPSAVAGVSGTTFSVSYDAKEGESLVTTEEGQVNVRAVGGGSDGSKATVRESGLASPIAVRPGYYVQFGRKRMAKLAAMRQVTAHRQMWSLLKREGILQQKDNVRLRLQRGVAPESRLFRYGHPIYMRGKASSSSPTSPSSPLSPSSPRPQPDAATMARMRLMKQRTMALRRQALAAQKRERMEQERRRRQAQNNNP